MQTVQAEERSPLVALAAVLGGLGLLRALGRVWGLLALLAVVAGTVAVLAGGILLLHLLLRT